MENNRFSYCPDCGSRNVRTEKNGRLWKCPDCGTELYNNVASAVGAIVLNDSGECLFEIRAKEPKKGFIAIPGGFMDPDESAEESLEREIMEETGAKLKSSRFLCSFPNTYPYKGITYKTCDLFFEAEIDAGSGLKAQESEVSGFKWLDVSTKEAIEALPIAFDSTRKALLKRLENKK